MNPARSRSFSTTALGSPFSGWPAASFEYDFSGRDDLPAHLKGPAVSILWYSMAGMLNRPFEITLEDLRSRVPANREKAMQIAHHLGWELEG